MVPDYRPIVSIIVISIDYPNIKIISMKRVFLSCGNSREPFNISREQHD
jgi:hypothetical protein